MKLSFSIRAAYDVLPTKANLKRWSKEQDDKCPLCNSKQTLQHVLSGCKTALARGRYTYRHNKVLEVLAQTVQEAVEDTPKEKTMPTNRFVSSSTQKPCKVPCNLPKPSMLNTASDWKVVADLNGWGEYPEAIKKTGLRPDIVLSSNSPPSCILVELTVPYETNIEEQHEYKQAKYKDLLANLKAAGIHASLFAVEIGARGFVGASMYSFLKRLDISGKKTSKICKDLATVAENASCWIWCKRNEA